MPAQMKTMGPECCCCNDLYASRSKTGTRNSLDRVRVSGNSVSAVNSADFATTDNGFVDPAMDFLNKLVYGWGFLSSGTFDQARRSLEEDLTDLVDIISTTGVNAENSFGVWPYPADEYLFYGKKPTTTGATTTASLSRVNYDGSGDTALVSYAESGNNRRQVQSPCVPRDGSYVFYITAPGYIPGASADKFGEIHRCALDGTGDTVIYTCPNRSSPLPSAGGIGLLRIDNTHSKVIWREFDFSGGSFFLTLLRRCDYDGSNVETYLSLDGVNFIAQCPFWSHKKQRYYYYRTSLGSGASGSLGLWSLAYDGSGHQLEVLDADWIASIGSQPGTIGPGCGFEVAGSGYQV